MADYLRVFRHVGFFVPRRTEGGIVMSMISVVTGTPYYVLMDGNRRLGPNLVQMPAGMDCMAIYGFTDKGPYESFRLDSHLALTPYPLVKVYLRSQIGDSPAQLKLVVIDATGLREPILHAATMKQVLEAHESGATHVTARYQLIFDSEVDAYRVEDNSV